ncbi:MAG: hypothetical protein NZM31_03600 [Gemmatales bacterium]|nr:hypothetical protein [Gemmatales bacterium]MDW8386084.1 hypothetical protein [Gemmatales bacterium]
MSQTVSQQGLLLPGLDGTNPLGFLAALGTLRVLSLQKPGVKLAWQLAGGTWRPVIFGVQTALPDLGAELYAAIQTLDHSAWSIDKRLPFSAKLLRQHAQEAARSASYSCRQKADILASFGVEYLEDNKGAFEKTDLCMVRAGDSAGQGLTAYAKRILETTTADELQRALAQTWLSADNQCALRWDPAEDKPYALQWINPSKVGALSEKGANCLALFGMVCFPVLPGLEGAETTGFGLRRPKQSSLTWPIWRPALSLAVVTSLLACPELQKELPDPSRLNPLGVAAVFRCDRIMTSTYYANFTPSRRVA